MTKGAEEARPSALESLRADEDDLSIGAVDAAQVVELADEEEVARELGMSTREGSPPLSKQLANDLKVCFLVLLPYVRMCRCCDRYACKDETQPSFH